MYHASGSRGSQSPPSTASGDGTPPLPEAQRPSNPNRYAVKSEWNNAPQRYQPAYSAPIQDWSHLRAPRAGLVAPQLGMPELSASANSIRIGVPLKNLPPADRTSKMIKEHATEDVEMEDVLSSRRKSITPPSSRLYPFITTGNPADKLPAIRVAGRASSADSSSSPPSTPSSVTTRRSVSPVRVSGKGSLPSLNSLSLSDPHIHPKIHARSQEVSFEERICHAKLIRALLVAVNQQWLYENQRSFSRDVSPMTSEGSDDSSAGSVVSQERLITAI